jgi:hypothetical protein
LVKSLLQEQGNPGGGWGTTFKFSSIDVIGENAAERGRPVLLRPTRPTWRFANGLDDDIAVLLSTGDGRFRATRSFGAGELPLALALGDFNGDAGYA